MPRFVLPLPRCRAAARMLDSCRVSCSARYGAARPGCITQPGW